ncbi:MAG TPA: tetratricopeptide repeat protein [Fimbriimonas sp.]
MSLLGKWFGFSKDEIFDEAVSAYDRGDYEAATEGFEECLDDTTDNATARLAAFYTGECYSQLGIQRSGEGAHADALRLFKTALRYCPNYPDIHLRAAKAADELQDVEQRNYFLRAALKINPRYIDAMVFQGISKYADGQRREGLEAIASACDIHPELEFEVYSKALAMHEAGDYEGALGALKRLSLNITTDASLHKRVGDSFSRDGLYEEAAGAYRRAIELHPRYAEAHCRLAQALYRLDRYEEALDAVDQSLRLNPNLAEAHAQRGTVLKGMKREIDARCEFQRAKEIDPNHPVALREGARLL